MFTRSADVQTLREMVEYEVVNKGLDGLRTCEGLDLFGHIVLNAESISVGPWLSWLTAVRGLMRIAALEVNPDWIGSLPLKQDQRTALAADWLFPAFESGGTWVCAALQNTSAVREGWEKQVNARLLLIAPTPVELRNVARFYR